MVNEFSQVESILKDLKAIIDREDKRHMMDQHLTTSMRMLLEDEIIPQLQNELETSQNTSMDNQQKLEGTNVSFIEKDLSIMLLYN